MNTTEGDLTPTVTCLKWECWLNMSIDSHMVITIECGPMLLPEAWLITVVRVTPDTNTRTHRLVSAGSTIGLGFLKGNKTPLWQL